MRTFFLLSGLALAACSSGGSDSTPATANIVFTDAPTDELSQFEVDVTGIQFTKQNGGTVSVLPRAGRVDFLQLDSLAELVAVGRLEPGRYSRATVSLDFSDAEIVIAGQSTPATVQDQRGQPITGVIDVVIDLAPGARPTVRAGGSHLFVFDLDLDQSLTIDATGNVVTFTPAWSVTVDPSNAKPIVLQGTVHSVDTATSTFLLERRDRHHRPLKRFSVHVGESTVFQLGGVVTQGAVGLGALIGHIGQFAYVQGTFDRSEHRVDADAVESGAGVPGNGQDYVLGHVTGRTGGPGADATLQVLGKSFRSDTHGLRHHATYTVDVSNANTHVLRRGAANSVDTDSLNVGQLVWVFGALTDTTLDATATDAVARLLPIKVSGLAAGPATDDALTLDVDRIDKREISAFDFTVSGVAQADPHAFVVDVTGLVASGVAAGSRVRATGWISPVGAEGADATAFVLSARTATDKTLLCAWLPADPNAIDIAGSTAALRLNVTDADLRFVVDGTSATMLAVDPAPQVQGLGAQGVYRILQDNALTVFTEFEPFRAEVVTRAATNATLFVRASGTFDATSQLFAATKATIVLD